MPTAHSNPGDGSTAPVAPSPAPSDLETVDEVLRGNREMFEVIVRRYNARLYRIGISYLRDHAQTEDAMQNAYLRAFLHLGSFKRIAAFSTWLTRIMINECLMVLRQEKPIVAEVFEEAAHDGIAATAGGLGDPIQRNEMRSLLESAIATLPQAYRTVYILREVQQLSTAETAESLGISADSVKVILHRARARLKEQLLNSAAGVELFTYPAEFCNPMTERVLNIVLRAATRRDDT